MPERIDLHHTCTIPCPNCVHCHPAGTVCGAHTDECRNELNDDKEIEHKCSPCICNIGCETVYEDYEDYGLPEGKSNK